MEDHDHSHPEKIRVFPLADPQEWVKNKDAILKTILAAIDPGLPGFVRAKYTFSIDPVCGWIRYNLESDIWHKRPKLSLPQSREEAAQLANRFLAKLQDSMTDGEYHKLGIAPIVPVGSYARIAHVETVPVLHYARPWVDHWLCRFEVKLKSFERAVEYERVYGSAIEIRIGQNGKVVSFTSQWRPVMLNSGFMVDFIRFEEDHEHEGEENSAAPQLIYELDGENCPQTFLTPYHLMLDGHHGGMFPASSYSLAPQMVFSEHENGGATVIATVRGGKGSYEAHWAFWRPDMFFDEGLVHLGEAASIELPPGSYSLMLHLKDLDTGVVKLLEQMVFVKGKAENIFT